MDFREDFANIFRAIDFHLYNELAFQLPTPSCASFDAWKNYFQEGKQMTFVFHPQ